MANLETPNHLRTGPAIDSDPGCKFCYANIQARILMENGPAAAILDGNPVTEGHMLVIPRRHTPDYFSLHTAEKEGVDELIGKLRKQIIAEDPTVTGFNIGVNCGESAGQTIFHVHFHLIPRRDGDAENPRGGIRGVIPGKRDY